MQGLDLIREGQRRVEVLVVGTCRLKDPGIAMGLAMGIACAVIIGLVIKASARLPWGQA